MSTFASLTNHFLIAMPMLMDPNFHRTVTYICEHNTDGAMGIVINQPLDLQLGEVLTQMNIEAINPEILHRTVFFGGPVHTERGFVLHSPAGKWESTLKITEQIGITTSRDIVSAVAEEKGPPRCLFALGFAGWGAGQLEQELSENAWLSGPADLRVIFSTPPEQRYNVAAALLGVDINSISSDVGHA
jgi:putative transcriptional regulator